MASNIDDLLAEESDGPKDIDALLADAPAAAAPSKAPAESASLPWYRRYSTGWMDPVYGDAQLMQNVTHDKAMNVARTSVASMVGAIPGVSREIVEDVARPRSDEEFNALVQGREQEYQGERKQAGQEGFDWWRTAGALTNPMTWLSPASKGAGIVAGIKAGAKTGAFQALLQPVTREGNFLWDKGMQLAVGAGAGGTLGGALEMLRPAFSYASRAIRGAMTKGDDAATQTASERITAETLKAAGAEPTKVDPNLYSAIQREVGDAIKAGVDPDPKVMANYADAAALPVPVQLTRGQASRDPMQFAWEHRVAGQQGAGEPIAALMKQQNRALIENLNELGARSAPSTFDVSQRVIKHIQDVDDQLRSRVNQAYTAVRDSAGRPAKMDHVGFVDVANNALDQGQLGPFLPEAIRGQLNDIAAGKLPLTVNVAQQLDKVWSAAQRGTTDASAKMAIGELRNALNGANVADSLGQESMAAYKAARTLAKQHFDLIDANPAYKAIVDGLPRAEPDKFFQTYVSSANVSELQSLKQLVGGENTKLLQQTTVGNLKRAAINKASDENGVFSQAAYNGILHDPVAAPRLRELFADAPETLGMLYRVGRVSENLIKIPAASKVNTSNTASAKANIVRDVARSETGGLAMSMLPNWIQGLTRVAGEAGRKVEESKAVSEALTPQVTAAPLPKPTQSGTSRRLSDLLTRGGSAAAAYESSEE